MKDPLVSVIIPLYNQEKNIAETLTSALDQTYKNIEVIVVDDGSNDGSADVVRNNSDPRIRYFFQQNSGLPAKARNQGLKLAQGTWVAFLDHDDVWLPNKLELQLQVIRKDPQIKLISGNAVYYGNISYAGRPMNCCSRTSFFSFTDLISGKRMITSTVMVDKHVIAEMGGFREFSDLIAIEDYDLWLRIAKENKVLCLAKTLAKYRILTNSTIGSKFKDLARIENYLNKYLPAMVSSRSEKRALAKGRSTLYLNYGLESLKSNEQKYRSYLLQAFRCRPFAIKEASGLLLSFLPIKFAQLALFSFKRIKPSWFYEKMEIKP